jgi:hypothetical protein
VVPEPIPDVVREGDIGILVGKEPQPPAKRLAEQHDARWRAHAAAEWWAVMPLNGGLLLVPEPLLRPLRAATRDDVMFAVDHANDHGRCTIADLFSDIVADVLREKRGE